MNIFSDTERFATKIANMVTFASLSQKQDIKDAILMEVALCCIRYSRMPEYKDEIDEFIAYQKMKEKYERC